MKEYKIDLTGKKLGRVSSEIAVLLMGKNLPDFSRNTVPSVKVILNNPQALDISKKKLETKIYDHYSGYPGGRKEIAMGKLIEKKGYGIVIRSAVNGMLPKNRLQSLMMKNLIINE